MASRRLRARNHCQLTRNHWSVCRLGSPPDPVPQRCPSHVDEQVRFEVQPLSTGTLRFSMTISLASVGLTPIICSRFSLRLRRDFRTVSGSCEKNVVTVHDSHHLPAWRLEGTPRHLSHHYSSRFDSPFRGATTLQPVSSRAQAAPAVSHNILSRSRGRGSQAARRTSSGEALR